MKRALTLLALVATHAAMAGPNLLVNGGFESTSVANGGWVIVTSMPGWTWLGGAGTGFEIRNNNAGAAQEGQALGLEEAGLVVGQGGDAVAEVGLPAGPGAEADHQGADHGRRVLRVGGGGVGGDDQAVGDVALHREARAVGELADQVVGSVVMGHGRGFLR